MLCCKILLPVFFVASLCGYAQQTPADFELALEGLESYDEVNTWVMSNSEVAAYPIYVSDSQDLFRPSERDSILSASSGELIGPFEEFGDRVMYKVVGKTHSPLIQFESFYFCSNELSRYQREERLSAIKSRCDEGATLLEALGDNSGHGKYKQKWTWYAQYEEVSSGFAKDPKSDIWIQGSDHIYRQVGRLENARVSHVFRIILP